MELLKVGSHRIRDADDFELAVHRGRRPWTVESFGAGWSCGCARSNDQLRQFKIPSQSLNALLEVLWSVR